MNRVNDDSFFIAKITKTRQASFVTLGTVFVSLNTIFCKDFLCFFNCRAISVLIVDSFLWWGDL